MNKLSIYENIQKSIQSEIIIYTDRFIRKDTSLVMALSHCFTQSLCASLPRSNCRRLYG